jgi:hypothetical protein
MSEEKITIEIIDGITITAPKSKLKEYAEILNEATREK